MTVGMEEGTERSKIEIAKNLLLTKLSIAEISNATGLSIAEIEKLKN